MPVRQDSDLEGALESLFSTFTQQPFPAMGEFPVD
jgi:hypothetical protein